MVTWVRRTSWRMLPWLAAAAGAMLFAPAASAQPPNEPAAEARYWLTRIHEAIGKRSFLGTFVVSAGGSMASARIAHYCEGGQQYERIEALDGRRRQVLRHGDLVTSLWPQQRLAVVETRGLMNQFPALLSSGIGGIVERYHVRTLGEGRVAGHEAHVLLLSPKDGYRYGHRLWAEKHSGLLLRAEVLDERETVVEASAFSDLIIGVKPQPELVLKAMKQLDGYRIERPTLEPTDLQAEGWALREVPPGFAPVSTVRRPMSAAATDAAPTAVLQSIWSDGLTHVSVFIEPYSAAAHGREATTVMGATQTLTRRLGDAWVTVVGDVPAVTLKTFALGLERRR